MAEQAAEREARYRFGPLERRGLIAGWRGGQIATVAAGLVIAIVVLHRRATPWNVALALCAVLGGITLALWPLGGRTLEQWAPTIARFGTERTRGARRLSGAAAGGVRADGVPGAAAKADRGRRRWDRGPLGRLAICAADPRNGEGPGQDGSFAVVTDAMARTTTAVLAIRGQSFSLLAAGDKQRRVSAWAGVLGALAREGSLVHRLQWLARSLPDDGAPARQFFAERARLDEHAPARRSYAALLAAVGAQTTRHEVLLAVSIRADRTSARARRAEGGGSSGTIGLLRREIATLQRLLDEADITVDAVLDATALASAMRRGFAAEPNWAAAQVPATGGTWPWPMALESGWSSLRADDTWHATYWIAEWPIVEVSSEFLGPLLLGSVRRSVSVVMEPLAPARAVRGVEHARIADIADAELRSRGGFLATARRSRESDLVVQREAELADGHGAFRFSGYVTVTARSELLLGRACDATEQAAGQCRLELRRLFGDQERAFFCTFPLGRGLS